MDFNSDFEKFDFEKELLLSIITATAEKEKSQNKQTCWIGESRKLYVEKLLNCKHQVWIYKILCMHLATFYVIRICIKSCTQICVDFIINNIK